MRPLQHYTVARLKIKARTTLLKHLSLLSYFAIRNILGMSE